MELLGCLFFNMIWVVGFLLSGLVLSPLLALLPFPHWLSWPVCVSLSLVHGFLLMGMSAKLLVYRLRWRGWWEDRDVRAGLGIWTVTAAACVIACITYILLAPLRLAVLIKQCLVGAAGYGFWMLAMHNWTKRMKARSLSDDHVPGADS